jgi:hypothetical protein
VSQHSLPARQRPRVSSARHAACHFPAATRRAGAESAASWTDASFCGSAPTGTSAVRAAPPAGRVVCRGGGGVWRPGRSPGGLGLCGAQARQRAGPARTAPRPAPAAARRLGRPRRAPLARHAGRLRVRRGAGHGAGVGPARALAPRGAAGDGRPGGDGARGATRHAVHHRPRDGGAAAVPGHPELQGGHGAAAPAGEVCGPALHGRGAGRRGAGAHVGAG